MHRNNCQWKDLGIWLFYRKLRNWKIHLHGRYGKQSLTLHNTIGMLGNQRHQMKFINLHWPPKHDVCTLIQSFYQKGFLLPIIKIWWNFEFQWPIKSFQCSWLPMDHTITCHTHCWKTKGCMVSSQEKMELFAGLSRQRSWCCIRILAHARCWSQQSSRGSS